MITIPPPRRAPRARPARSPVLVACLLALLAATGCGEAADPVAQPRTRVLVVGADGLEWSVLQPLMAEGRCPNLRGLMERGAFGKLATFIPTLSPVVWTSISTSKSMEEHGIRGMVDERQREYTSSRRAGRALWNIADRYGLTTNSFGWWITWPVEPVRGVMVSGTSASAMLDKNWKPALMDGLPDQVHPPDLTERVLSIAREVADPAVLGPIERGRVFKQTPPSGWPAEEKRLIDQTMWSILSDETYLRIALDVLPDHPADLTLIYFGGTDVAGHRFWRHYQPDAYAWRGKSPEADAALACVLPNYYEWFDDMLGRLLAAVGDDVTTFVISDHGMHAIATEKPNQGGITGDHQDGTPGVIIAAGPGIRQQGDVDHFVRTGAVSIGPTVMSVTPTVLALLGIPAARDMRGRAHTTYFTPEMAEFADSLRVVPSHDEDFREPYVVDVPADKEREAMERYSALGYVMDAMSGNSALVDPTRFDEASEHAHGASGCH